jgi:hypothetical protein
MFGKANILTLRLSTTLAIGLSLASYANRPIGTADLWRVASDKDAAPSVPQQVQPQAGAGDGTGTHQTVIAPPSTGDAAINKGAPPEGQFPTPVIHPPKTPDSPSAATPKN